MWLAKPQLNKVAVSMSTAIARVFFRYSLNTSSCSQIRRLVVYTTNRRIWEHDDVFKEYLKKTRAMAVDMETATLFSCGFANHIPTGALLLVSDQPMTPDGVKTDKSDNLVTRNYVEEHVEIGIASLRMIIDEKKTVKHLKFDW